jgi:hypothetical protein
MLNPPFSTRIALTAVVLCAGGKAVAGTWLMGKVAAREIAVHTELVDAGDSVVELEGSRTTDLDCYVYDRLGSLLGYDNGVTDRCRITIRQRNAGEVRVEIENLGNAPNAYRLRVDPVAVRSAPD